MVTKTISVSSIFPAASDTIWPTLAKIETLQYIAAPYATFAAIDANESILWHEGAVFRFRLRVFGFVPMGIHTIQVQTFDKNSYLIETIEGNKIVPIWKHKIRLVPLDGNTSHYTDEVEIGAGWRTDMVSLWGKAFYRHRQKKWLRILKSL